MGEGAGGMVALSGRAGPQTTQSVTFAECVVFTSMHISKKIPETCLVASKTGWQQAVCVCACMCTQ